MLISKAAHRYAIALLEITREDGNTAKVLEDMQLIRSVILDNRELLLALKSPIIKYDVKQVILKQVFEGKVQPITSKFIDLIASKKREAILHQVANAYIEAYKKAEGIVDIEVMTAYELDKNQIDALKKKLETELKKTVEFSFSTDAELKGGLAVKIGDTIVDGSVKHQLDRLKESLMETTS
jgi:F-type H+-transporting ATPase subunit delta